MFSTKNSNIDPDPVSQFYWEESSAPNS